MGVAVQTDSNARESTSSGNNNFPYLTFVTGTTGSAGVKKFQLVSKNPELRLKMSILHMTATTTNTTTTTTTTITTTLPPSTPPKHFNPTCISALVDR